MSLDRKKSMGGVTGVVPHTPAKGSLTPLGHAVLPITYKPFKYILIQLNVVCYGHNLVTNLK